MNDSPDVGQTGHPSESEFESRLISIARTFPYPPAPDVTSGVVFRLAGQRDRTANRRLLTIGIIAVLILAIIFAVPPVRAAILDWFQIGAVRIFMNEPTLTPTPTLIPGHTVTPRPTDRPTPTPLASILDLSGEMTLLQAQSLSFPLLLPAYPPDLGQPDHVYVQDFGGPVVVMVWMDKASPPNVRLSLSETNLPFIFQKFAPPSVENATVNGQPGMWVDAPYLLITGSGNVVTSRLIVKGHTLIWTDGLITYRLETSDDLVTAIKIAESLRKEP